MSLTSRAKGTQLFLLGGSHAEWNAGKEIVTKEVSLLRWNSGSRNYSWDDEGQRALGMYPRCLFFKKIVLLVSDMFIEPLGNSAAGVPDNFLSSFEH